VSRVGRTRRVGIHFWGFPLSHVCALAGFLDVNAGKGGTLKMDFQDKVLKCVDCGADFVFTAGEQLFFHDKQFKNEPKRCKNCKGKRAQALGLPQNGGNYQRVETKAVCSGCQRETTVPFKPTQGRPVFCRECFQQRKTTAATA
jgi:CxxC-x17-CxxC domain-containing protein